MVLLEFYGQKLVTLISHGTRQFMEGTKRFIGQFMLVIMFSSEMYSHRTFHYQS